MAGLAFAGVRDLLEFLHYARTDRDGRVNPLAGDVRAVYSFSMSQPSRFLHDFLYAGFNADSRNRRVFDGVLSWIGGASGGFFNDRFAQPGRTHRQHIGRWYPERQFPFADATSFDPATGRTDGRLAVCAKTGTCPRIFEVNSENEYWAKAGSLLHTDTQGRDLQDPPTARIYLLSSLPHSRGRGPTGLGNCQQLQNPPVANATLRALLAALDARRVEPCAASSPWLPVSGACAEDRRGRQRQCWRAASGDRRAAGNVYRVGATRRGSFRRRVRCVRAASRFRRHAGRAPGEG